MLQDHFLFSYKENKKFSYMMMVIVLESVTHTSCQSVHHELLTGNLEYSLMMLDNNFPVLKFPLTYILIIKHIHLKCSAHKTKLLKNKHHLQLYYACCLLKISAIHLAVQVRNIGHILNKFYHFFFPYNCL